MSRKIGSVLFRMLILLMLFALALGGSPANATGLPLDATADFVYGQPDFITSDVGISAKSLYRPAGTTIDNNGNLYIVDSSNHRVLYYPAGSAIATRVYGQFGHFNSGVANNGGVSAISLNYPFAAAVDGSGNLYVADTYNNRVLYYPAGSTTATRVYGQGGSFTKNNSNNGGSGASADSLYNPKGVAVDDSGNLYVSDASNNRVLYYPAGSTTATRVYGQGGSFTSYAANKGGISADSLYYPYGVAVDGSGTLYVADTYNNRTLSYPAGSATATRVYGQAGSFTTATRNNGGVSADSLYEPGKIIVDSSSGLYITDASNNRVLYYPADSTTAARVYGQGGSFTTNTNNKGGISADSLYNPCAVALDNSGNLYIADYNNNRVLYYPADTTSATRVYGQFAFTSSNNVWIGPDSLSTPKASVSDQEGNLYIADYSNNRVLYYPAGSAIATRVYGQGGSLGANTINKGGISADSLNRPSAVALDAGGNLYVADYYNARVLYFSAGSTSATRVYGQLGSFSTALVNNGGVSANSLAYPTGLAVDGSGNLYVADANNNRVLYYPSGSTTATRVYGQGGSFTVGIANNGGVSANSLNSPAGLALDAGGNLYVADQANKRALYYPANSTTAARVYGQNGSFSTNSYVPISANSIYLPDGLASDSGGNLYLADSGNQRVLFYPSGSTTATRVYGQAGSFTSATANKNGLNAESLCSPSGLALDNNGYLLVADYNNNRVLKYLPDITAPVVASFTVTSPSNNYNIPIAAFTVTDSGITTGYMITTSPAAPAASDPGWASSAPTVYTVGGPGTYLLYPWAKDEAGNVSALFASPRTAVVTDLPEVSTFNVSLTSTSLNISISAFVATSPSNSLNGYQITTSPTPPAANDPGWSVSAPTMFTVSGPGSYTLYPWAKDTASTVSAVFASPRVVTVNIKPLITAFTITSPTSTLNIPITAFSATDEIGVAGYLVTTSATQPAASASGWTTGAPTVYKVASAGTYILYPWAKNSAGYVSAVFASPRTVLVDIKPIVTAFAVTTPSNNLNIPITAFSATDDFGVTGYLVTTSATQPAATASGWAASPPTYYHVASAGAYNLYPWAKNTSGKVSTVFASPRAVIVDTSAPGLAITSTAANPTQLAPIPLTLTFSEPVTGISIEDLTVGNGAASDLSGSGAVYTVNITPASSGVVVVQVAAGAATDATGNGSTAAQFGVTYGPALEVYYARPAASGLGSCVNWANACTLQTALMGATSGAEIWVAAGTHKPTSGSDRNATFQLVSGVAIYGGFAGAETAREQRNFTANITTLSGDLLDNDAGFYNSSENVYHVVTGASGATLDGVTVTAGNANGSGCPGTLCGGGIYNVGSSPTLANLTISGNSSNADGGGMSNVANSNPALTNVLFSNNSAFSYGGGMYNYASNPVLTTVTFSANSAFTSGGGMLNYASSPTLSHVSFTANSATSYTTSNGGGMANLYGSSPTLTDVIFSDNSASNFGGAMYNISSSPTLNRVTLNNNQANSGGGLYNNLSSNPLLTDVIFSGNTALLQGGGMYNTAGSPLLTGVSFSRNSAGQQGGGLFNSSGNQPTLTNVTFSTNTAHEGGGGIFASSGLIMTNVTISGNSADFYGGGMVTSSSSSIRNTLIWGNTSALNAQLYVPDSYALFISDSIVQDGYARGANILSADPLLGAPGGYGGFSETIPLLAGSAAIDAGNDSLCPTTDQRGLVRPQGARCDIGAFEYVDTPAPETRIDTYPADPSASLSASFTFSSPGTTASFECSLDNAIFAVCASPKNYTSVSAGAHIFAVRARNQAGSLDPAPAIYTWSITPAQAGVLYAKPVASGVGNCLNWANACSLQTALANALSGDEIWVASGKHTPTTDPDRNATFQLKSGVAVYGGFAGMETTRHQRSPAANLTVLSGDIDNNDSQMPVITDIKTVTGNTSNSYHVVSGANGASLDGFTITAGYAAQVSGTDLGYGAGMLNTNSSPTLVNVIFSGNSAAWSGGGMYNTGSSPRLTNVIFRANSATNFGGGLSNISNSNPILLDITFSANSAKAGGGVYNASSSPRLMNVTFSLNSSNSGGGLYNDSDSGPLLLNATFSRNTANNNGGGMYNASGRASFLTNVTFKSNTANYYGGGLYNNSYYSRFRNAIFWDNTAAVDAQVYNPSPYNLLFSDSLIQGGYPGANFLTADPLLGELGNYGGLTETIPLLAGSPAMDAGNDTLCPASDQRGITRPQGAGCDIGAYEYTEISAPETQIDSQPANPSASAMASFTFSSLDAAAAFECSLDYAIFSACASPKTYSAIADGAHSFRVRAKDQVGHLDPTPAVYPWTVATHTPTTLYAKPTATGTGTCAGWANACTLKTALSNAVSGDELWVAAGTHKPTTNSADRSATFQLKSGVAVYGGFSGTETARDQRSPAVNVTVLSGDIDNNDSQKPIITTLSAVTGNTTNSTHVVTGADGATLDGFTITAGYANGGSSSAQGQGAGMYNSLNSSPVLANLTFRGNSAYNGGGMYNGYASHPVMTNILFSGNAARSYGGGGMLNDYIGNPTLTNVTFSGNTANYGGGMENIANSSPLLNNVTFNNNSATADGGGMYNDSSRPVLTNVTFHQNQASSGGGMVNKSSSPLLSDVLFSSNAATSYGGGGMQNNNSSNPTLTNVSFNANSAHMDGGGIENTLTSNPTLTNVSFSANSASSSGGGMSSNNSSPTLTNVTFSANTASSGGGMHNSGGSPRLTNVTFSANTATNWGGGMENVSYTSPTLTNVTFNGNAANYGGGMDSDNSSPKIRNAIFWGNTATTSGAQVYNEYNVNTTISDSIVQGGYPGGTDIITTDPLLGALSDNGGFTQTIQLLAGSSAIDTGNDSLCPASDQRGMTRPQGAHCDMGAYEYVDPFASPSPTVTATETPTPTVTLTPVPTQTFTPTATVTETATVTQTFTPTTTVTLTPVPTQTFTPTATATETATVTQTFTPTATVTLTPVPTQTFTPTATATETATVTQTFTPTATVTLTPVPTQTFTPTATATETATVTQTFTPTATVTLTPVPTQTFTPTATATETATVTQTFTLTPTVTETPVPTQTLTPTATMTETATVTQTFTSTPTVTLTPIPTQTFTPTATATETATVTQTFTPTPTVTETPVPTQTFTPTATATETATLTLTFTPTPTVTLTPVPTQTFTPTATATETATVIQTFTPTPTVTETPVPTQTFTPTATATETATLTLTFTPTPTVTLTPVPTQTFTPTATGTQTALPVATFSDVPVTHWAWSWIERLYAAGVTNGCGVGKYCPEDTVTRAQMAVFLLRGKNGAAFTPPPATGIKFSDVSISYWAANWIEQLAAEGITNGCGPSRYCPDAGVTRAEMAVFLLRGKHGSDYTPPAASGVFSDVPTSYWAAAWIEQLAAEGITNGCGTGTYCPDSPVTRAQMAVFLVRAFNLP